MYVLPEAFVPDALPKVKDADVGSVLFQKEVLETAESALFNAKNFVAVMVLL